MKGKMRYLAYQLVELGSTKCLRTGLSLPPWPVIGTGSGDEADARSVDVVASTPALRDRIVTGIERHPGAAAVLVQLLRAIDGMGLTEALTVESLAFSTLQASADHARWLSARPSPVRNEDEGGDRLTIERRGDILGIILDRPQARNAIDRAMRDALSEAFELVAVDRSITTVTVRGRGDCFSIGGDLSEFGTTRDPLVAHEIRCRTLPAHHLIARPEVYTFHLHGGCVGAGVEMAAFAGRLVAAPDAWFQLPELAMGLIPGAGGCVSIPRRIGRQRTALMMLTGKRIGAATALDWGLIDAIAPVR